jgi:predicted ABC-type ATPase
MLAMNKQKFLMIVGGANGSGKTTFALEYAAKHNLPFVNADEIAKRYDANNFDRYKLTAGKTFFAEIEQHFSTQASFIIESTFSGKYLAKIINKARNSQYHISIAYLYLEHPDVNISRVRNRVLQGVGG